MSFFLQLLVAIIGIIFSFNITSNDQNFKRVLADICLVVLGFTLAVGWDIWQDYKEKGTIIIMMKTELAEIHATIKQNMTTVDENLKLLQKQKEVVRPLLRFHTDAWSSVKLRNNVFLNETSNLFKFINLYTSINIVNEKIKFRDEYRIANQEMPNYNSRLEIIDKDIKSVMEKITPLLKNAQETLDKMHTWKVKGKSFSIDSTGNVIDKSN